MRWGAKPRICFCLIQCLEETWKILVSDFFHSKTVVFCADVADETIKAVHQDLQQQGFDCWDTSVGAMGVSFHPEPHEDASIPPTLFQ